MLETTNLERTGNEAPGPNKRPPWETGTKRMETKKTKDFFENFQEFFPSNPMQFYLQHSQLPWVFGVTKENPNFFLKICKIFFFSGKSKKKSQKLDISRYLERSGGSNFTHGN